MFRLNPPPQSRIAQFLFLSVCLLFGLFDRIQATSTGQTIYLPLVGQNQPSLQANLQPVDEPIRELIIEGVVELPLGSQPRLRDPWGNLSPIALHTSSNALPGVADSLQGYAGQYVRLTGRWIGPAEAKVFIASRIQHVAAEGERYASYVQREMSDPSLRIGNQAEATQAETNVQAQAVGNPAEIGEWSPVQNTGMYALHAVLRPDGQVMFWYKTGEESDDPIFGTILWDPVTTQVTQLSNESLNGQENWCATHTQMGDGRMLAATGNIGSQDPHSTLFDFRTNLWTPLPNLNFGRYYPSAAFMGDGRVVISGGDYVNTSTLKAPNPFPEVWEDGAWRIFDEPLVTTTSELEYDFFYGSFFPWNQQAPNGQIFYAGPQSTLRYLDPDNLGTVTNVGERDGLSRDYGSYATYGVGKILVAGGGDSFKSAYTIDINQDPPLVQQTGSLNIGRRNFYTTILADGSVLATGGHSEGGIIQATPTGAIYFAELWDPATGVWTKMDSMARRREYHSSALLLPDARVVHAGGDCTPCAPQANLEVFSPPYLFKSDGSPATRPTINNAPGTIDYGQLFEVDFGQASGITDVNLIRLGSSTHSTNFDQRLVPLDFAANVSGNSGTLTITGPLNIFTTPPGYYMLFLINNSGVPSIAKIVKVGTHVKDPSESVGLQDGGFEGSQRPAPGTWVNYAAGTTFGSWTVTDGNVDVQSNVGLKPADGSGGQQNLDLNGTVPGSISQTVTNLKPGQSYALSFDYAIHHLADWASATIEIAELSESLQATNRGDELWLTATYSFTATSTQHPLVFISNGGLTYAGMLLDDIRIDEYIAQPTTTGRPLVNLALNRPATQSSKEWNAARAVDGNTAGNGVNQISLTDLDDQAWWQVDLGSVVDVDKIEVWNRTDCCPKNLGNFYLLLSETDLSGRTLDESLNDAAVQRVYVVDKAHAHLTKQLQGRGRYLRIQATVATALGLAEVAVYGPPKPNALPQLTDLTVQVNQLGEPANLRISAIDDDNDDLTFILENLPLGVTASAGGLISGTLNTAGLFTVDVTVADGYGGSAQGNFVWRVNTPPTLTSPGTQSNNVGDLVNLPLATEDADGDSLIFSVDLLPDGLILDSQQGVIGGTLATAQVVSTTVIVSDPHGGSVSVVFMWQVNGPPKLAQPADQSSTIGDVVDLLLQATDEDTNSLNYSSGSLPPGVSLITTTGQITGILSSAGTYTISVGVRDPQGLTDSATFFWHVNTPPQLTAPDDQTNQLGDAISLAVTGIDPDDDPILFRATGLPTGVAIDAQTGVISGTLAVGGHLTVTLMVADRYGATARASFAWAINHPPNMAEIEPQLSQLDEAVNLQLAATDPDDDALMFRAGDLPPGLSIDKESGRVSGKVTSAGDYLVTVTVDDGQGGQSIETVQWRVNEPPTVTPLAAQGFVAGEVIMLQIMAQDGGGAEVTFESLSLPLGLTLDPASGLLSGRVATPGTYQITIDVHDGDGGMTQVTFTLTIDERLTPNIAPKLTSPGNQQQTVGDAVTLRLEVDDVDGPMLTFEAVGLPDGLVLVASEGVISGTVTTAGTYQVTITVDDGDGGSDSVRFMWTVVEAKPIVNGESETTEIFLPVVGGR